MKKTFIIIITIFITSCAANPVIVDEKNDNDEYLNCYQINEEIKKAEHYKKESRKDDKFKWQYMMPLNAIMSTININRAESGADKRLKFLEELSSRKGCTGAVPNHNYNNYQHQQNNNYQYQPQNNYNPEY